MTTTDYRYKLETPRLTGRRQEKIICPHCGRKSFVRYVDTQNDCQYVADVVGKCDHQHSCGYHYKPSEYYHDNQWMRPTRDNSQFSIPICQMKRSAALLSLQPLPMELVEQCHSPESVFWQWFTTDLAQRLGLDLADVQRVYEYYHIGADPRGNVIFWQIDEQQRVRTGHIMQYQQDGKRHDGYQNWVHRDKNFQDNLPEGFVLRQCFFGLHLLPRRPEAQVCLVESEKTALIMAAYQPEYLWLATAGSGGLSPEKVECLRGRRFTLFPDSGCFEKWQKIMERTEGMQYTISEKLEQYPQNTDFADLLLRPP